MGTLQHRASQQTVQLSAQQVSAAAWWQQLSLLVSDLYYVYNDQNSNLLSAVNTFICQPQSLCSPIIFTWKIRSNQGQKTRRTRTNHQQVPCGDQDPVQVRRHHRHQQHVHGHQGGGVRLQRPGEEGGQGNI